MSEKETELARMRILRLSNEESNRITRECIESALILLIKEKNFSEITITDIVKKAGVSRTAYYRNYKSKEDILQNLVSDIVIKITSAMSKYDLTLQTYEFWLEMFSSAKHYADVLNILFSAHMGETIFNRINDLIIKNNQLSSIKDRYTQLFWNGAAFSVLSHWITHNMQETPEQMANIICTTLKPPEN